MLGASWMFFNLTRKIYHDNGSSYVTHAGQENDINSKRRNSFSGRESEQYDDKSFSDDISFSDDSSSSDDICEKNEPNGKNNEEKNDEKNSELINVIDEFIKHLKN